jgi:hypothetical protein
MMEFVVPPFLTGKLVSTTKACTEPAEVTQRLRSKTPIKIDAFPPSRISCPSWLGSFPLTMEEPDLLNRERIRYNSHEHGLATIPQKEQR